MRIDSAFPSDYLKAADLNGEQVVYTIQSIAIEEIGQKKDRRPVLYFEECEAGFVLNKTNSRTISDVFGLETDEWIGRQITLYEKMVEFEGKEVPAIRVRMPRPGGKPAARRVVDDPIPF
jgi:hypothetical protein